MNPRYEIKKVADGYLFIMKWAAEENYPEISLTKIYENLEDAERVRDRMKNLDMEILEIGRLN